MLTFRCQQCELDFDAEPDDTGYEQAPCPTCGHLTVTRKFLQQERQRNRLPIPRFSLRMLLLVSVTASIFLGLSLLNRTYYRKISSEGYQYGFPMLAVEVTHFRVPDGRIFTSHPRVSAEPLIIDLVVFVATTYGISKGLHWASKRMTMRQ